MLNDGKINETDVMDLFNKGLGTKTISNKLNCSLKTIRYFLIKKGLRKGYKPAPKPKKDKNYEWKFWNKVNRTDPSGCWIWKGTKDKDGYGRFKYNSKRIMAHRIAYLFTHGYLPSDARVCHACDNTSCCNPHHLFLGSDSDNIIDCIIKKRHSNCKLSVDEISPIKNAIYNGSSVKDVAEKYNVSQVTIYNVLNEATWWYIK
jgi:HNH endonuclease